MKDETKNLIIAYVLLTGAFLALCLLIGSIGYRIGAN